MRATIFVTLFVLFATGSASASPSTPVVFPICASDTQSAWNISLGDNEDYAYQWADNENFTDYKQVAGAWGYNYLTTPRIERIWVRWASTPDSVVSAGRATKCDVEEPDTNASANSGRYVFLPLILNGYAEGEIEFKVWRRCISGQVIDKPAKNLQFVATQKAPLPELWIAGTTNVVGEGRIVGTYFTVYLGAQRQLAEYVWYDPNAEPFYLWYYDYGC